MPIIPIILADVPPCPDGSTERTDNLANAYTHETSVCRQRGASENTVAVRVQILVHKFR
jgi:hypothetical protein